MDDSSTENMIVPVDDLSHEIKGFIFRESFFVGNELGQVALITEFCDNVSIVFGGVNVINFNDIFSVFQGFKDLHF